MSSYELDAILQAYYNSKKESWEQIRTVSHTIASVNSTKPLKKTEVIEFPWDKEEMKAEPSTIERFEAIAEKFKHL